MELYTFDTFAEDWKRFTGDTLIGSDKLVSRVADKAWVECMRQGRGRQGRVTCAVNA